VFVLFLLKNMADTKDNKQDKDGDYANKFPKFSKQRPSRDTLNADIEAVNKEIAALDEQIKKCKSEIDNISKARTGSRSEVDAARGKLNQVMTEKRAVMAERSQLVTLRDQVKASLEANKTAEKNLRTQLRFGSLDVLNGAIRDLERRQMTTSLNLQEEKRVLNDIKTLKAMRSNFSTIEEIKKLIEVEKGQRDDFDKKINDMNKIIDAANAKVAEAQAVVDSAAKATSSKVDALPGLRTQQTELRAAINEKFNSIGALRDNFKKQETEYFEALKEFREKEKVRREQEAASRREKLDQERKEREAAELLRIPYEEEMKLCDFLINYLTLQKSGGAGGQVSSAPAQATVGPALVPRVANAPEGMVALNRDSHEDPWAPPKKTKDNASKAKDNKPAAAGKDTKKKGASEGPGGSSVRHDLNSIALFGQIGVAPPMNLSGVNASIEELKAKKSMYSTAERGALPSMYDSQRSKEDDRIKAREQRELEKLERLTREIEKENEREQARAAGAPSAGGAGTEGGEGKKKRNDKQQQKKKGKNQEDNKGAEGAEGENAEGDAAPKADKKPRNKKQNNRPNSAPEGSTEDANAAAGEAAEGEAGAEKQKKPRNNKGKNNKKAADGAAADASSETDTGAAPTSPSSSHLSLAPVMVPAVVVAAAIVADVVNGAVNHDSGAPPGL
jgi:uncharacterized coiled-coil DUF342 family protein